MLLNTVIRIVVLSFCMGVYMIWAFRGIEDNPLEAARALLELVSGFLVLTVIGVPIYARWKRVEGAGLAELTFRWWLVTAILVTAGWLVFYSRDLASQGYFSANLMLGTIGLVILVAVANYLLVKVGQYLSAKRG